MSFIPVLLLLFALSSTLAQKTTPDASTLRTKVTEQTTTQTTKQTTTPPPSCESKNGTSCEECLSNVNKCMWFWNSLRCLWCIPNKRCLTYPVKTILPPNSLCPLNDARWGLCTINFQILIITLSVAGALLIIGFFICIFCCCKCENIGSGRIEKNMNRKADKRKTKQGERTAELKTRHDEIRQKYGLSRASPYARFENPT